MRGLAALLVLASHFDSNRLVYLEFFQPYRHHAGAIGVYLFFILSGFLIWASADKHLPLKSGLYVYFVHRSTRVMPLYYVALLFGIFLFPLLSNFPVHVDQSIILRTVFFTQALNPSVSRAINPVIWTLTHEVIFYCLVPLLFLIRRRFYLIFAIAIISSWWAHTHQSSTFSPFLQYLFLFVLGMTLSQYKVIPNIITSLFLIVFSLCLSQLNIPSIYIYGSWSFALISLVFSSRRYLHTWIVAPLAFVGVISYSLYIWHYMLIEIVGPFVYRNGQLQINYPIFTGLSFIAFCLIFSFISYNLIEKPGQESLRTWLLKRSSKGNAGS